MYHVFPVKVSRQGLFNFIFMLKYYAKTTTNTESTIALYDRANFKVQGTNAYENLVSYAHNGFHIILFRCPTDAIVNAFN